MNTLDIARRMAELGQYEDTWAYTLALQEGGLAPEEEMEAALYILQTEGNYKVAYEASLSTAAFGQSAAFISAFHVRTAGAVLA